VTTKRQWRRYLCRPKRGFQEPREQCARGKPFCRIRHDDQPLRCRRSEGGTATCAGGEGHAVPYTIATQPVWHCGFPLHLHSFYSVRLVRSGKSYTARLAHHRFAFSSCDDRRNVLVCPVCQRRLSVVGVSFSPPNTSGDPPSSVPCNNGGAR